MTGRRQCLQHLERVLHRQGDRLLVASVVGELPLGGLGVEHRVEGELRQAGLNVSRGCCTVAGQYVTPVTLRVDEQVLLSQLHEGVTDGGVAVGVELHGMSHDVGHLVISAVVHALHRVHNAALHGLEAVLNVRHGTFQDYIAGVIQEPVLVHAG